MCDYSLHAVRSRPAKVGEELVSTSFRLASTSGFAARDNREVAVCLLPGTELAFEQEVKFYHRWIWARKTGFRVARFCQVDAHVPDRHHDALEFPDGKVLLVTLLTPGPTRHGASASGQPRACRATSLSCAAPPNGRLIGCAQKSRPAAR